MELTNTQKFDCKERIDKANAEIAEICKKYQVEPVIESVKMAMGDTKYKGVPSSIDNLIG